MHLAARPVNALFPPPPSDAEIDGFLERVVRAPSVLNTQPWRFVVDMGAVHVYADRSRQLLALDPLGREMTMSCGAAVFCLRVAARHAGWDTVVLPFPLQQAPDLVAAVTFRPGARPDRDDRLFHALSARRTDRHSFSSEPLPSGIAAELGAAAAAEGATVHVFEGPAEKDALAGLVASGVAEQRQDPAVAGDVAAWVRPLGDPRPDGVRDAASASVPAGTPPVAGDKDRLIRDAPAVVVLSTAGDDRADWLTAGQALARVLAVAAEHGLAASYADEPVEVAGLREQVAALTGGGCPQAVFRIGRAVVEPETPRRAADDVTEHAGHASAPRRSVNAPASAEESLAEAAARVGADVSTAVVSGTAVPPALGVAM